MTGQPAVTTVDNKGDQGGKQTPSPQDAGKGTQQPKEATTGSKTGDADGQKNAADAAKAKEAGKSWVDGATGDDKQKDDKGQKTAPPEKYELQDDTGRKFHPKVGEALDPVARKLGLDNDGANAVVKALAPVLDGIIAEHRETQTQKWRDESRADPKLGGDKFDASSAVALKAFNTAPQKVRELLVSTGIVEHPQFREWMHGFGSGLKEDRFIGGKAPNAPAVNAGGKVDNAAIAAAWYGGAKT